MEMSQDEMFDILYQNGEKTGEVATKYETHRRGLWHTGVHLCVTDGLGNVYQQLRGRPPHIRILPDVWDLFLVAGHVSAGEDPLDTLGREAREEVGIELSPDTDAFREVGTTRSDYWVEDHSFPDGGYNHRVIDHNFVVRLPGLDMKTLVLEENKVIAVRQYPIARLREDLTKSHSSLEYLQHAHRPVDDELLYDSVLSVAEALTF